MGHRPKSAIAAFVGPSDCRQGRRKVGIMTLALLHGPFDGRRSMGRSRSDARLTFSPAQPEKTIIRQALHCAQAGHPEKMNERLKICAFRGFLSVLLAGCGSAVGMPTSDRPGGGFFCAHKSMKAA